MVITVKAARVNAGKTQQETADYLGLSLTGYKRKENGDSKFYVDEIVCLSHWWGVPVENFFEATCRKKTQSSA